MDKTPSVEVRAISSTLRWEEVSLPESVSETDLDQIIFAAMTSRLRKIARVRRCGGTVRAQAYEILGGMHGKLEAPLVKAFREVALNR
jgi:hypothetical protein